MEKKKSLIIVFISVIGIHLYLFASIKMQSEVVIARKVESTQNLTIQKVVIKKQESKPIENPKKKILKEETTVPKTKSKNIIAAVKKREPVKKEPKEEPKKEQKENAQPQVISKQNKPLKQKADTSDLKKALEDEYLLKIRETIDKNKIYPMIAKRLGQTGKVYLNFTIKGSGQIVDIKIVKNAQYKRLDDAATEILVKIKKFEPIPNELNKATWNITVPVLYQIIRS
ncbi:MAG: energy transducer TonB [Candidatus Marinarcus sp.]|uniref:energy transducer TonB n=1 Tax=Candidatus Marinarcus sp. TaxID=3100987 RepID=UPI003AFFFFC1